MTVKLLISALANSFIAILLYILEKKTPFGKIKYNFKQIIFGVLFGAMAIYSSTPLGGIDIGGAIMNVRDAAPLCAGLIFGIPAGIIAGVIGGVFRYIAPFLGIGGTYTQLACSISTILAGIIAAVLRKFMFDNKKPTWIYGIGIAMITEVLHMLMIFFTNMNDVTTAFGFVKSCTVPMVLGNGIAVGVAVLLVSIISREKLRLHKSQKQISQTFQMWLLVCIVIAFAFTSIFISVLQTRVSETETESVIEINLGDVYQDISDASDENLLNKTKQIIAEYLTGGDLSYLAEKYNVIEVNIIDENGIITETNNAEFVGYDMASGEQSAEFLVLLEGKKDNYVQDYRPTSYDNKTYRKYAAMVLPENGFLQVGYDASQFGDDIDAFVGKVAKNRHIGNSGFVTICDENFSIVTEDSEHFGENLDTLGIRLDTQQNAEGEIFEASVKGVPHLLAYHFVEGYYIVGAMPQNEAMFMKDVSVYVNIFMEIVIFAALFVLIYFLIKRIIIDNIRKINGTLAQITDGNLNVTVDVRSNEEFASLSDDINSTVSTLKRYIAEAAARIDKELEFAKQIQYSSLPTAFPVRSEFELYAEMITAKEVGGDFYDFYMLNDSTIAFLVADVSGKGIPAAMFMMRAKTIIKDLAESGMELSEVFTKANEKLCENNDAGMFVTAWMGAIDLKTGTLSFANAGHNPPLLRRADGDFEYLKARSGLILAGMDGIKYKKNEVKLNPGDQIYLYTDGVTEATNENEELYGENRLQSLVNTIGNATPQQLCAAIKDDVNKFVDTAPQFDDITMLCLSLNCILSDNEISVIPNQASREAVNVFADTLTAKLEVIPKIASKINIIFDEIYTNILNYSKASLAGISYSIEGGKLYITFTDNGIPYNPLSAAEPDITLSAEEREIGGLGIFMVKKMTESMEYFYEDNKNILRLVILLQ